MSNNTHVNDVKKSRARIITNDKNARIAYADHVKNHGITLDSVPAEVREIVEQAYPGVKPDGRADKDSQEYAAKCFANRVRNGLNYALGKTTPKSEPSTFLLTALGVEELAGLDAEELFAVIQSELEDRAK